MVVGENGILNRATDASKKTNDAKDDELRQMAIAEAAMNFENTEYNGVTIPAGFAPTRIEGEDSVENGLVITDSKGNEFVWIPVENSENYTKNTTYDLLDVSQTTISDKNYLPENILQEGTKEEEIEKKLVINAKGFFISRYEAGDESANSKRLEQGNGKLVSKKNMYVYNFVSQSNSKELAKNFINNNYVKSSLITSIQWDMVMKFIDGKKDANGNDYNVKILSNLRHKGHDFGVDLTGNNENDKVCNIYDLEGNCREYVASQNTFYDIYPYVFRGGFFDEPYYCASQTGGCDDKASEQFTFRFVLYVM